MREFFVLSTDMKLCGIVISLLIIVTPAPAQTGAQERAANLRLQLSEVQAKESELRSRLEQLEYDLKPENIERSLAGVGSVHPEELREQRRRQLEGEKKSVLAQLDLLAASRTRLEAAIAQADAESYRQSANPVVSNTPTRSQRSVSSPTRRRKLVRRRRHRTRRHSHADWQRPCALSLC